MVQGIFPNEMILDFLGKPKFAGLCPRTEGSSLRSLPMLGCMLVLRTVASCGFHAYYASRCKA